MPLIGERVTLLGELQTLHGIVTEPNGVLQHTDVNSPQGSGNRQPMVDPQTDG